MIRRLPVAFSALMILARVAAASDVVVHVTDPHQLAIPGAIVTLTSQSSQHWTATTDLTGSGRLTGLAAGRYFIQTAFNRALRRLIARPKTIQ